MIKPEDVAEQLWLDHSTVFNDGHRGVPDGDFQEAVLEAITQTREQCAKVCEDVAANSDDAYYGTIAVTAARQCAAAIRGESK